jgi:hypothetical protein
MSPAFSSTQRAAAFSVILLFFLTLPIALRWIGNISREEVYCGISERAGGYDYIRHQIFELSGDVDILYCGNSLLVNATELPYIQGELSRTLGRTASVVLLPQSWQGPDLNYFVTRDLMEHRKVKMLVIAAPAWIQRSNQPHVQLFRVVRYGDHPGALDGLPLPYRLAIYSEFVLGAPRHALDLVRPNLIDHDLTFGIRSAPRAGYMGRPFVFRQPHAPALTAASMIYSPDSHQAFRFDGPPLNPYQLHFIRKTAELARQHGALLVILHMPSPAEHGSAFVLERQLMPLVFGENVAYLGVPSARLFQNTPAEEFEDYYVDEHFNWNGMQLFTRTITPALIHLYEQHVKTH